MGRPRKEIDEETFEKLCVLQCTEEEICGWFDVTKKTLISWCRRTYGESFSTIYAKKRGNGKISLRRMQWKLAERSSAMAIFLGKQYLGQKDDRALFFNNTDVVEGDANNVSVEIYIPENNRDNGNGGSDGGAEDYTQTTGGAAGKVPR